MIDESKLIFFTGAPGSKWSAVSYILGHSPTIQINTSDRAESREYSHSARFNGVRHVGSYFGPGFEFGEKFRNINTMTKDEVIEEINKPFAEEQPLNYRIIRSHQFVYNLDWIKENFPTSKIIVVLRPLPGCHNGWFGAGGFDITYPTYEPYYKDEATMKQYMFEECQIARKWVYENDVRLCVAHRGHWDREWNINGYNTDSTIGRYIRSVDGYMPNASDPSLEVKYDVTIAYHNFGGIL